MDIGYGVMLQSSTSYPMGQSLGLVKEHLSTLSLKALTISTPASAVVSLMKPIAVPRLRAARQLLDLVLQQAGQHLRQPRAVLCCALLLP